MRARFLTIASALFVCAALHAQEPVALTPSNVTMAVGETQTLAVPADTNLTNVTFTVAPETVARFNKATMTLTALAAGDATITGKDAGGNDLTTVSQITVHPIKISGGSFAQPMIAGESKPLDVEVKVDIEGGAVVETNTLQFTTAEPAIAKVEGARVIAGDVTGSKTTTLNITRNGVSVGTIPITVLEAIASIEARDVTVQEEKTADLEVKLIGRHGSEFKPEERKISFDPAEETTLFAVSPLGVVEARRFDENTMRTTRTVEVSSSETFRREGPPAKDTATLTFVQRPGQIVFDTPVLQLPREGAGNVRATVMTRSGATLPNAQIDWSLRNPDETKWLKLVEDGPKAQLIWNRQPSVEDAARPNVVEIVATATAEGATVTGTLLVRMSGAISEFAPLSVRLNLMDDHTVRDLFGARAAGEYFVARVRLNNNIDAKLNPALAGSSILAFSESLEVAVIYEKRPVQENGKPDARAMWTKVEPGDLEDFREDILQVERTAAGAEESEPRCSDFFTYRPFDASMMINTADRRDMRSRRGRIFTGLHALGTVASAVTGVAVPGATSDWPLALEKYSNLFVPGLEKIWPSLKETHRQNLVSYAMRPLEEIPFGADISRVLFFPKGPFYGLLRGHQARVAQICPFHFKIEVAVIDKKQTVTGRN